MCRGLLLFLAWVARMWDVPSRGVLGSYRRGELHKLPGGLLCTRGNYYSLLRGGIWIRRTPVGNSDESRHILHGLRRRLLRFIHGALGLRALRCRHVLGRGCFLVRAFKLPPGNTVDFQRLRELHCGLLCGYLVRSLFPREFFFE